ncbi:RNHCP domain-containing protein [Candidatus Parcubacteria bacterium]|nr:RNHCP domain-containing protein [Candidatus Parcubacteria bacterium]
MPDSKFQRNIEDFKCEHCGHEMKGTGYTNHCSECLWSKHVDVNPGDRASQCGGMMKPVSVELNRGEYAIIHKCEKCGHEKKNKAEKGDNFSTLLHIAESKSL